MCDRESCWMAEDECTADYFDAKQIEPEIGPAVEPDAIKELLDSGVKVSRGRLYVEWADEA